MSQPCAVDSQLSSLAVAGISTANVMRQRLHAMVARISRRASRTFSPGITYPIFRKRTRPGEVNTGCQLSVISRVATSRSAGRLTGGVVEGILTPSSHRAAHSRSGGNSSSRQAANRPCTQRGVSAGSRVVDVVRAEVVRANQQNSR